MSNFNRRHLTRARRVRQPQPLIILNPQEQLIPNLKTGEIIKLRRGESIERRERKDKLSSIRLTLQGRWTQANRWPSKPVSSRSIGFITEAGFEKVIPKPFIKGE